MTLVPDINFRLQKESWKTFLYQSDHTHVAHFAVNQPELSVGQLHKLMQKFHHQLDKSLLFARPHKLPAERRTQMTCVFEKLRSNPHSHAFITPPPGASYEKFEKRAKQVWEKLVPSGSLEIKDISYSHELDDISKQWFRYCEADYLSKELWKEENLKAILLLPA